MSAYPALALYAKAWIGSLDFHRRLDWGLEKFLSSTPASCHYSRNCIGIVAVVPFFNYIFLLSERVRSKGDYAILKVDLSDHEIIPARGQCEAKWTQPTNAKVEERFPHLPPPQQLIVDRRPYSLFIALIIVIKISKKALSSLNS